MKRSNASCHLQRKKYFEKRKAGHLGSKPTDKDLFCLWRARHSRQMVLLSHFLSLNKKFHNTDRHAWLTRRDKISLQYGVQFYFQKHFLETSWISEHNVSAWLLLLKILQLENIKWKVGKFINWSQSLEKILRPMTFSRSFYLEHSWAN